MNPLGVYKMEVDYGRMGCLTSVFTATRDEISAVRDQTIRFGEVLGKHSDVSAKMTEENLYLVSESPEVVQVVQKHDLTSGPDPIQYWNEQQDEL